MVRALILVHKLGGGVEFSTGEWDASGFDRAVHRGLEKAAAERSLLGESDRRKAFRLAVVNTQNGYFPDSMVPIEQCCSETVRDAENLGLEKRKQQSWFSNLNNYDEGG
ncbi:hypothetical protein VNO78_12333 [Psophocarpus tetragonolobus]|uniref:Uncharacterized protein n=1 Tax=Psophocarpus tetragonolobus TaxID=3891 RepID=A0AAN9SN65_PSOTE